MLHWHGSILPLPTSMILKHVCSVISRISGSCRVGTIDFWVMDSAIRTLEIEIFPSFICRHLLLRYSLNRDFLPRNSFIFFYIAQNGSFDLNRALHGNILKAVDDFAICFHLKLDKLCKTFFSEKSSFNPNKVFLFHKIFCTCIYIFFFSMNLKHSSSCSV